jgi:signal transduction histidine kinase
VARNEWKYVARVETDLSEDLPLLPCYRDQLAQVFLNLIINAAHAIADVVDEASGSLGIIKISTHQVGSVVEIRISDTGPGVPDSLRDKIFDPFFTTKDVGKGTGQGLAIARSVVVDKHGGTLELESEPGKGATFVIRLPLGDVGVTGQGVRE